MTLTENQQAILNGLQNGYEEQVCKNLNADSKSMQSLHYENNRYYFEIVVKEFSEDEIKKLCASEIVTHLLSKKCIKADGIEIGRASDAVKILQHYLLTRKDV